MTKHDLNNIALTDEELEAAAGGAGQWVPPSRGQWWVWKESQSSFTGNPANFHATAGSGSGNVRSEMIDGKRHFIRFDGTKEVTVAIR